MQPWLTFTAIDFISGKTRPTDRVFEYGGGGSTLFFLSRVAEVVTVEHDPHWFQMLQQEIKSRYPGWGGHLVMPESPVDTGNLDISNPGHYKSNDPAFPDATFRSYSSFIANFSNEYFDLVLIDGRARTSCIAHALSKVKRGGYLALDNAERQYYLKYNSQALKDGFRLVLDDTGPVPYSPYFSKTSIWQRIS